MYVVQFLQRIRVHASADVAFTAVVKAAASLSTQNAAGVGDNLCLLTFERPQSANGTPDTSDQLSGDAMTVTAMSAHLPLRCGQRHAAIRLH